MACINCFDSCGDRQTTDRCVEYTGEDVEILGICKEDTLYQIELIVIEKLQSLMNGTGVTFDTLTLDCDFIKDLLSGQDIQLANIIQAMVVANCTLKDLIDALSAQVNAPFTLDASCLTLGTSPTRDDILRAAVSKICAVSTKVDGVSTDYVKASELCAKVVQCIKDLNDGNTDEVPQEGTKMAKYCPIPYVGPLTVFDSSGAGIAAQGYDKVYLCNGQNGTRDFRGYSFIGANVGVPGGALDAAVDPALPANAGYALAFGGKKGEYTHTNTLQESAVHSHVATTSPHSHFTVSTGADSNLTSQTAIQNAHSTGGNLGYGLSGAVGAASVGKTSDTTIAVTVSQSGGGQPHNNTHPVAAVYYIIYLP